MSNPTGPNPPPPPVSPPPTNPPKPPDGGAAFALAAVLPVLGAGLGGLIGRLVWSPLPPGKRTEWSGMGDSVRKFGHVVGGLFFGGLFGLLVAGVFAACRARGKKSPRPAAPDNQQKT